MSFERCGSRGSQPFGGMVGCGSAALRAFPVGVEPGLVVYCHQSLRSAGGRSYKRRAERVKGRCGAASGGRTREKEVAFAAGASVSCQPRKRFEWRERSTSAASVPSRACAGRCPGAYEEMTP